MYFLPAFGFWLWATAQPALRPELAVIDRMMGGAACDAGQACPAGNGIEVAAVWEDWDRLIEMLRIL